MFSPQISDYIILKLLLDHKDINQKVFLGLMILSVNDLQLFPHLILKEHISKKRGGGSTLQIAD